jgi:uncharacterized protein (DUF2236 family)
VGGLFDDSAVIRRVLAEPLVVFGGGRALLLQLAHPLVAAGVAEHSRFRSDPAARLRHTLDLTGTIVYGDDHQVAAALAAMRAVHERVTGTGYAASDPALQLWVHATLVDTALLMYERFLRPLSRQDAERYYQECVRVAEVLGVPQEAQPVDLASFRAWMGQRVDTLTVSDDARLVAREVLYPRVSWAAEPWVTAVRQLNVGLLPGRLRRQYRLGWDGPRQLVLTAAELTSRQVLRRLPFDLRRLPAEVVTAAALSLRTA